MPKAARLTERRACTGNCAARAGVMAAIASPDSCASKACAGDRKNVIAC